jgi:hypothetical protein
MKMRIVLGAFISLAALGPAQPLQSVWDRRQQTADIQAFVLSRGGFPAGETELAREAEVLKQIRFEATRPSP